ncbi:Hypothetical protein SCF082_LOCUS33737 [Durusdinium trenchii]|uniref:Methyltransferase domain-containing protein n=1 Tax=Durusdinium trenchii TaxID=1381693 RepID=A0ABP0NUL9_9DINO
MPAPPIHYAIGNARWDECRQLLLEAPHLVAQRGRSGATALVQALRQAAPVDLVELMLSSPEAAQAAKARVRHQTAADVAEELKLGEDLVARLRRLERSVPDSPGKLRCPSCGDEVMKRSQLTRLRERVEAGEEENCLVRDFFVDLPVEILEERLALHRAANCHNFRQEVSETMAVLKALDLLSTPQELHVVDLCSGSGLTSCALGLRNARVKAVTAVDLRPPQVMPHFQEAGLPHVRYLCQDMTKPGFFAALEGLIVEVSLPVVLLGMHCCGALSVIAMRIYQAMPQCVALVLCPCCSLRSLDIKRAERLCLPESLVAQGAVNSYDQWVSALLELLPEVPAFSCQDLQALHAEQKIEVVFMTVDPILDRQDAWETTKLQRLAPEDLTRGALASSALPTVEARVQRMAPGAGLQDLRGVGAPGDRLWPPETGCEAVIGIGRG